MDAKPQRPFRPLRFRDENALPAAAFIPTKSIHQRNKSSPALAGLAQAGSLKGLSRRTAFADVSNNARNIQYVRDDSTISKKTCDGYKDVQGLQSIKTAELQRPAQRPLSVASFKGFLNTFSTNHNSTAAKPKLVDLVLETGVQANTHRKIAPKKSTAIFFDTETRLSEPPLANSGPHHSEIDAPGPVRSAPESPRADDLPPPVPQHYTRAELISSDTNSATVSDEGSHINASFDQSSIAPAHANLPVSDLIATSQTYPLEDLEIYQDASAYPLLDHDRVQQSEKAPLPIIHEKEVVASSVPLPGSDATEYWDYELDEAGYEEEGYTTARSLKSRVDYTTGATTVIMAPKMTSKAERELARARQFVSESRTADDIEADESWDTSMVAEYGDEIFEYMRTLEERMRPNPHYMDSQTEVQWSMRSVLMDWLVQVHFRFSLLPETLYLCVNYIDRFLSSKVVSLGKLQLVGATAIFVAAKYEEINCPSVQEIVYMVDGGYTVEEILKAERFMLSMLQFELGWPGPMSFLRRISKADDYDLETRTLAKYFLELTIMDERFVASIPSFTAAGAHCLARLMLKKGSWTPAHVFYSDYTYSQLRQLMLAMLSCCEDPQKHHSAIFDKYGDKRFKRASFFVQSQMNRGFQLPLVQSDDPDGHRSSNHSWNEK